VILILVHAYMRVAAHIIRDKVCDGFVYVPLQWLVEDTTMKLVTTFDETLRLSLKATKNGVELIGKKHTNYEYNDDTEDVLLARFTTKGYSPEIQTEFFNNKEYRLVLVEQPKPTTVE